MATSRGRRTCFSCFPARPPLFARCPFIVGPAAAAFVQAVRLSPLERLQFVQGARPVRSQQPRQTAVDEILAPGLAAGTIVGFIIGVANALNLCATSGTWFPIAPMNSHALAECGDLFRECAGCFRTQAAGP